MSTTEHALATQARQNLARDYYALTKPGIIRGNALTAIAGFFLAAQGTVNAGHLVAMLVGLSLIIASGCVCNNYIDRDIDSKMDRTRARALVSGAISGTNALVFAALLGISGTTVLLLYTNVLTTSLAVFGFFAYVVIYGVAKRRTVHGTVIGSISGAIPPVVGYCAVAGRFDISALLLFMVIVFWQMPHFYAIAMYRMEDYRAAGIPVLPLVSGMAKSKVQSLIYIAGFTLSCAALAKFGTSGPVFLVASTVLGIVWLSLGVRGLIMPPAGGDVRWARMMFGVSLVVISLLCLALSIDSFLPWK